MGQQLAPRIVVSAEKLGAAVNPTMVAEAATNNIFCVNFIEEYSL